MADVGHYIGCLLGVLAALGIMVTVIHHEWKHTSDEMSPGHLMFLHMTEGLWLRCVYSSPGFIECDNFGTSMLALPGDLHARRALTVFAEIFAFAGVVIGIFSLPCTTLERKLLFGRISGGFLIAGGILCLIPVSMYGVDVANDFYASQGNDFMFTFGPALYVGWVSGVLSVISGILMIVCAKDPDKDFEPAMAKMAYI